jgi:hypothetical protein
MHGKLEEAGSEFRTATSIDSANADARCKLGIAL